MHSAHSDALAAAPARRHIRAMEIARTLPDLHRHRAALGHDRPVALVATMGGLHEGHRALMRAAAALGADIVASIFVNPLQFGQSSDYERYPRTEADDLAVMEQEGCRLAWVPGIETMYPPGAATVIDVGGPAQDFEGTFRPGHFRGVATVVAKLFLQTRPDVAVFGEKDWQQVQVVRRLVADLDMPVRIETVPTVRDSDGLALSSRNRFLGADRALAPLLSRVLQACARAGGTELAMAEARARLEQAGFAVDYVAAIDPETMGPPAAAGPRRLIAAARLGSVRLLDTLPVSA